MDGAANAADDFLVRRTHFEFKPRFIERLKKFARALEEESAQFAAAVFGRTTHEVTSMRWYAVPLFSCTM